jgi:hypothetical protein
VPLTIGEVHTGLLLTSAAVPAETATALLAILPGGLVRSRQRPVRQAWSPELLTGVDCQAPIRGRREVRVVGTPATRLSLTDGHILQAGTYATVRHDPTGRRRAWAHYLAQPGVLEVLGKEPEESLASGFLAGSDAAAALDLGAVNTRALAAIQRSRQLDRSPPFRSRMTRLRWSAQAAGSGPEMVFTLGDDQAVRGDQLRTVRLRTEQSDPVALAEFCTDLALHDWLLTALLGLVDQAFARSLRGTRLIQELRPGIDHLVHAWTPAAHADRILAEIWQEFDRGAGFTRQWQKTVERIRDQLAVSMIEALQSRTQARGSEPL